jgi:hypothetical protein
VIVFLFALSKIQREWSDEVLIMEYHRSASFLGSQHVHMNISNILYTTYKENLLSNMLTLYICQHAFFGIRHTSGLWWTFQERVAWWELWINLLLLNNVTNTLTTQCSKLFTFHLEEAFQKPFSSHSPLLRISNTRENYRDAFLLCRMILIYN